ncbi:hypothetical protein BJ170DRAFT_596772 [Xylariales sp. AK1849]|nr:hypothetical protein BJ170DRAFT_596772 [Xylariales sp. AK1849]
MAEAFGVAASVSGIVSLGLELSSRIISYVDAVRRRDEEIGSVHRQAKNLQSSLDILKNAVPALALKHKLACDTVLAALKSGEQELEVLKDFVDRLTGPVGQPHNLKSTLKHTKKKMTFPFHREDLEALQQRLDRANISLQAAIGALGLVIVASIDQSSADALSQLSSLSTISNANTATSSTIKASLDTFIPQVDQALLDIKSSLRTNLPDMQHNSASTLATIFRQEANLTDRIQEARVEFREGMSKTLQQTNSLTSIMTSLDINSAASTTVLRSELLGVTNKLSYILDHLTKKSESDPPRLLGATTEQRALYRLVSSPAQLEKVSSLYREKDAVEHEFTMRERDEPKPGPKGTPGNLAGRSFTTKGYTSTCICRQQHQSLRRQAKLGGISINTINSIRWKHLPECRYAKYEVVSKSNSIRLSYNGLRWLLSKAVDISISLSTGSGGLSISPNITIRPTVDRMQAPVFRTLAFLCNCADVFFFRRSEDRLIMWQILEVAVHRILRQYMSRESSPHEVDSEGQSALHGWTDVLMRLSPWWEDCRDRLTAMTTLLLEAGLPASLCDFQGASPGTRLIAAHMNSAFSLKELTCILCEEAPEASVFEEYNPGWYTSLDSEKTFLGLRNTLQVIEILGCGPLTSAILHGTEAEVENIIALYPSTIRERNLIRQTPFHLATDKPRILRLLMAAASSQESDTPDSEGKYALDYALRLTPAICSNGSLWVACSRCPCSESVEIFLASGWRCRFDFLRYCDSKVSHTARLKMIDRLVSARAVLKTLGRQFLPSVDIDRYRLHELSVLDSYAHKVAELLLQHGVSIPASVRATLQVPQLGCCVIFSLRRFHKGPAAAGCPTLYSSVYHTDYAFGIESTNRLAELLYNNGFHDIDQVDSHGLSPLSFYISQGRWSKRPSYIMWLIEHGANVLQLFPVPNDNHSYSYGTFTAAHSVLHCNPNYSRNAPGKEDDSGKLPYHEVESYRRLVSLVAPMDQRDECHCQCVEAGCHTMKAFFEQIWETTTGRWRHEEGIPPIESASVADIAEKISNFLQSFALDLSRWDVVCKLALRYLTFEALELRHTCCRMPWGAAKWSVQEIEDIEDEDREKLDLLEFLLQDLQIAYRTFECPNGKGDRFTNFLTTEWSPRMQQVLAGIEVIQLTANDRLEAEEIGVRWIPTSEDESKEETQDLTYWLKRLDMIMPV